MRYLFFLILFVFFAFSSRARVYTGLEVFLAQYTYLVSAKRVGLITNPTGVNSSMISSADLMKKDRRINLVALFAPEHGIRGNVEAGAHFKTTPRDPATGLPVYSLYAGGDHKPSRHALAQVDVLVYDIQDVGSRAYTFIWHLAKCMEAAAEHGKSVIVLDRPNPFGGISMDGPVVENKYKSFIALYPIPVTYALTVGELAKYLNAEYRINCKLTVIPMINYTHSTSWHKTALCWVPTSPQIPSPEAAWCFATTGTIGTLGTISIGIGYTLPFQVVAAPWIKASHMAKHLNYLHLPGVKFRETHFKPYFGLFAKKNIHGVQLQITDPTAFTPYSSMVAILCYLKKYYPKNFYWRKDRISKFDKAAGTARVRQMIDRGFDHRQISKMWQPGIEVYRNKSQKYRLYK